MHPDSYVPNSAKNTMAIWGATTSGRRIARKSERQESPAGAINTHMKTFQEWLAERTKNVGLWLNDKNGVIGLSRLNPLPKNSAVNKSLAKGPAKAKAMPGVNRYSLSGVPQHPQRHQMVRKGQSRHRGTSLRNRNVFH